MDPLDIIHKFYPPESDLCRILTDHSRRVADKALAIARHLVRHQTGISLDQDFIEQAAMLHDIGIFKTRAGSLGCTGTFPYICHGYLGREILDEAGLDPAFGLVAERHTGAGITLDNIRLNNLPLPHRDMVPLTLEEKIICCADKFFSKSPKKQGRTATLAEIRAELSTIDPIHGERFQTMAEELLIQE
ncbi:MAG: HD domain-containing protein [Desulfobacterales bacterium]|nr:HD domain-containing protein [Desulfobacterales bacterium]